MKIDVAIVLEVFKLFIGAIALFLVLFGIHWIAILSGVILGILYFIMPKGYLDNTTEEHRL